MADVAQSQLDHLSKIDKLRSKELEEIRIAVRDLQSETDSKFLIGRLHREIIHLKLNDTNTEEDLRIARTRIRTLETRLLRMEQRLDHKERNVQRMQNDYTHRITQLRKTVNVLFTVPPFPLFPSSLLPF